VQNPNEKKTVTVRILGKKHQEAKFSGIDENFVSYVLISARVKF